MSEESVLRYRLEVIRLMPEGAYKNALIVGINASFAALRSGLGSASPKGVSPESKHPGSCGTTAVANSAGHC